MGKSSPQQPDPASLIGQQSALNRVNQFTPFGNIVYEGSREIAIPGKPNIKDVPTGVRVDLSPAQQQLLQQQQTAQGLLGQRGIDLAGQFSSSPMGQFRSAADGGPAPFRSTADGSQAAFAPGDFEASRAAAEQAVFNRGMSLLRPEQELAQDRTLQRLANQGLPQASQAYGSELSRLERSQGEERARLADAAVLQGLQAQQQGFGQSLAGYQTEEARRQQQFGRDLSTYQQDLGRRQQQFGQDLSSFQANQGARASQLQEILGLFGLQPVQLPQAQNVPQVDVPYQQGQQGSAGIMPGLLGLGGAALGAMVPGGGLAGAQFGFQAGSQLPGLFGY